MAANLNKFKVNKIGNMEGVTITFKNGVSVSIQTSNSHYCTFGQSVEVHAWGPKHEKVFLDDTERECVGWVQMDDLPALLDIARHWTPPKETTA